MEVRPPIKKHKVGEKEFRRYYIWFDESGLVKVQVVNEGPVQHSTHPKNPMSNFTFWVPLNLFHSLI
jgi:hypothetical protein